MDITPVSSGTGTFGADFVKQPFRKKKQKNMAMKVSMMRKTNIPVTATSLSAEEANLTLSDQSC